VTVPGEWLNSRYLLRKRLGAGGFGSVWLAFDKILEREVALKELVPRNLETQNLTWVRAQAENEARLLARLEHPTIVSIHDLITVGDNPWIVMGYFNGEPLEDIIRAQAPMREQDVARFGAPVLTGLMFAHASGVVHRDVKPMNILVGADSSVCLVDFGTAKPVGAETTGLLIGTLEYMAPERLDGASGEEPSDIWSLGVVFYYALTKLSPFNRVSLHATAVAIGRDNPSPPGDGPLARLVMQMLDKRPAHRPRGGEVAVILRQLLGQRPQPRPPAPTFPPPPSDETVPNPLPPGRRESGDHPGGGGVPAQSPGERPSPRGPERLDQMPPHEAAIVILQESPVEAGVLLLRPPPETAARIIGHLSHGYASELIAMITKTHPQRAGRILESTTPERAGVILSRMDQGAAARTLAAMRPADAAERLGRTDPVHAGTALGDMDPADAGCIIEVMDDASALRVLARVRPGRCATILKTIPGGRGMLLASRFRSTSFRRLVQEQM
jgi:serine/threonine protein kinase